MILMVVGSNPIIYPKNLIFFAWLAEFGRRDRLKICSFIKGVGSSPILSKKNDFYIINYVLIDF